MKIARFIVDGREQYGLIEGSEIKVIAGNIVASYTVTAETLPLADVKLLAPVKPSKVVGIGLNY